MAGIDVEERVRVFRDVIESCIKHPTVLAKLNSGLVISHDEHERLLELYKKQTPREATSAMMSALFNSQEPDKWTVFMDALKKEDYIYLREVLESGILRDNSRQRGMIRLFQDNLLKQLKVIPFADSLLAKGVINDVDNEEITSEHKNRGEYYALLVTFSRMQCHQPPDLWYYNVLTILTEIEDGKFEHLVEDIEPDFLTNPSAYMPKLGPIPDGSSIVDKDIGDVIETVMSVYEEGDCLDDEVAAPPVPTRSDSLVVYQREISDHSLISHFSQTSLKDKQYSLDKLTDIQDNMEVKQMNAAGTDMTGNADVAADDDDSDTSDNDTNSLSSDKDGEDSDDDNKKLRDKHPHFELRNYQLELAEDAVRGRNTIICSETGTGKTWVALHIIEKHLSQASNEPRKVAFMARTGVLIKQQAHRLFKYLPQFQTKLITAEDDESMYMSAFLPEYDIFCFTPQILVNNLDRDSVSSITEFTMLVFDECHHTKGDSSYNKLMRRYLVEKELKSNTLPQVVGLTASIGVGKSRTVEEAVNYITRVCACLDCHILSTVEQHKTDLQPFINQAEEETVKMVVKNPDANKDIIITAMEEVEDELQDLVLLQPDMVDMLYETQPRNKESQEYNQWTAELIKKAENSVTDHDTARNIAACAMHLNVYNSALEVNNLLQTKDVAKYLATKHRQESENKSKLTEKERDLLQKLQKAQKDLIKASKEGENPNVRKVCDLLTQMIRGKGDDSRAIVFVKARETSRALAGFLDRELRNIGVNASPLYGKNKLAGDEGMSESIQTDIVEKFKDGYYKVLVCTSVGTEGIDVPDCNIVISYDYSADEITKIQMRGRSRKKGGTIVTMGNEKQLEQDRINAYKAAMMYKAMRRFKQLDPMHIKYKVQLYQKEEMQRYRYRQELDRVKQYRHSGDDYEILCKRCNVLVSYISDVRKRGHDYLVIDTCFPSKINTKPHRNPKKYDGIEKKSKMYCKKCPNDWGIVAEKDGIDLHILKIISLKFRNMRTQDITAYKKWIDVQYNVPEIADEDLLKMFQQAENKL